MATIKLKVSDQILDKVLWLLGQFKSDELEIIDSDESFEEVQKHLQNELKRYESGKSKNYSIEQVDQILERTIREYEG